jgi:hypothetical protein
MRRKFTLLLALSFFVSTLVKAQCPTPSGMVASPLNLGGLCFLSVQFAIPGSNVSIYNASGALLGQAIASPTGTAVINYPCGSGPITNIVSLQVSPVVQICNQFTFTQIIVLPVKLISFSGVINSAKSVDLKWETAVEFDNEKFEIERSTDGVNYKAVGLINGNGTSLEKTLYNYTDASFVPGTASYYRLKQTDRDGKVSYSKVIYVSDISNEVSISAFPNPVSTANEPIQLRGVNYKDVTYSNIFITDMTGKRVDYRITGANAIELNPSAPKGFYFLRINKQTVKLLKQ